MKKRLLTAVLSLAIAGSLAACGNKEQTAAPASSEAAPVESSVAVEDAAPVTVEDVVAETEEAAGAVALPGTAWTANDLTVWFFEADGTTLRLSIPTEDATEEYTGTYELTEGTDGTSTLAVSVPDMEMVFSATVDTLNADTLEFTDAETGDTSSLSPYVAE